MVIYFSQWPHHWGIYGLLLYFNCWLVRDIWLLWPVRQLYSTLKANNLLPRLFRANKPGCGNDGGRRGRQQQCNSPKSCFHRDIKLPQKKNTKFAFWWRKSKWQIKEFPIQAQCLFKRSSCPSWQTQWWGWGRGRSRPSWWRVSLRNILFLTVLLDTEYFDALPAR